MTPSSSIRRARCGCGALTLEARGEPMHVYLCACRLCQIKTGSAFSYAAVFAEADVTLRGEHRAWRNIGESGRWVENHFCPACGTSVFFHSEGFPGGIGVPVGGFAEDALTDTHDAALAPRTMYWASRRRSWVGVPDGVADVDTQ